MLISIVIFSFGVVISFIVLLGVMNARDIRMRQRAHDFHQDKLHNSNAANPANTESFIEVSSEKPQLV